MPPGNGGDLETPVTYIVREVNLEDTRDTERVADMFNDFDSAWPGGFTRGIRETGERVRELGGAGGEGANPEQLFAAGYSACFLAAMKFVASREKNALPADAAIDGTVGIGPIPTGFGIEAELKISLPGMPRDQAKELISKAHQVCPYSNATRNNIDVTLTLV